MSGHTDAPVRCRGCGTIVPAYITGMAAMSRERPYSLSDEFHRYTMESDGLWRCGACQTNDELRKAWALIESLQADREKDRAELAALRERVAKLEAALVKADEMAKAADTATVWRDKESLDALDLALAVFAEANPVLDNDAREATK